ncbi:uncharacterized protein KY384_002086 [Bacidia gigantensis]|uniref:uncharacterized protein n=1 Tax=Bacidia gigantensis TaxID=2732470 RepID=UPI001D046099|nr:uncharacterized protein KY384_002086 [Bacidia gigantensis]KAG8533303.1 hypothetical protein KY384_002086 [Bacidia gigantensis]
MSLEPPTYLRSLQNNIRQRPIPWEGAVRAGTITEHDLKVIKAVDKVRKDQRRQIVEESLEDYQSLILGGSKGKSVLESATKRSDVVQYMLTLTGDLLNDCPSLISKLLEHSDPYKPILPYLDHSSSPEDSIPLLASSVLTTIASSSQSQTPKITSQTEEALSKLYKYQSKLTQSQDNGLKDIAVLQYSSLLKTKKSRELLWNQREATVTPLIDVLREAAGAGKDSDSTLWSGATSIRSASEGAIGGGVSLQLLYHVLLVVWQLSFESSLVGKGLERDQEIILLYTQLLRLSPKEKTTRLLLSTLSNLLNSSENKTTLLPSAVTARLPAVLSNLRTRHLTDPDLLEDLQALAEMLDEYTNSQTTFDEYAAEIQSGKLRWSPPHRDARFWQENARKILEEDGGALPRKLAEILGKEWADDKSVLAIGCNDVGWLVKEVAEQRSQLEKLGIKVRVMQLMENEDETVRWEALRAVGEWLRYSFDD